MAEAKKLPSGSWRVLLYTGTDAAGKRKYKSFTAPTKKEAEFLAAEYNFKNGGTISNRMPLGQAFDLYLASKSSLLSPSTMRSYITIRNNYLQRLMKKDINAITQADIQRAINLEAARLSPKTVRNITGLLVPVLEMYRPHFKAKISLPQKEKKDFYIPSEKVMARLYKKAEGQKVELPLLLASKLGLRASEIAGLTYDCIDREEKAVTIKQARVYGNKGNVLKDPKSYAGNRTIPCPENILEKIGEGADGELILKVTSNAITKQWMRFVRSSGERYFNFHSLRHYFCSKALLIGIPKKYVAELMGHATENMINRVYEHTFKEKKAEFAKQLISHFE